MSTDHPPPALAGLFLVGTDTGVGKTTVARALLRSARRRGFRLLPFKPVETGCQGGPPPDASLLLDAASIDGLSLAEICPYPFSAPLAPSVAARLENRTIQIDELAARARAMASGADALLLEGAGGLLAPWGRSINAATLATRLGLPLAVVAANRLGTINHTALAAAECERRRLPCAGFILVDVTADPTPDRASNAAEIAAETGLRPLGLLGYAPDADADALADRAALELDLTAIFAAMGDPAFRPGAP